MHILVTGGAGFIGSWLCEHFLKKGCTVTAIDNFSTGRIENLVNFAVINNFTFIQQGYDELINQEEIFEQADQLYHLASPVGVRLVLNETNVDEVIDHHLQNTRRLYEVAAKHKLDVFFASSSEVYGKRLDIYPGERSTGLVEDKTGIWGGSDKKRWWYAHLKKCSEDILLEFMNAGDISGIIGRLFNVTGPRQRTEYGMVIPNFVKMALQNQPLTVYGDGSQVRSFCSIFDCIKAIDILMNNLSETGSEIYNIGRSEPATIEKVAQKINDVAGNKKGIRQIPLKEVFDESFEEIYYRVPNTYKLQNVTGYTLSTSLEEILESVTAFYKNHPNRNFESLSYG